jgi:hypothetical protein
VSERTEVLVALCTTLPGTKSMLQSTGLRLDSASSAFVTLHSRSSALLDLYTRAHLPLPHGRL